MGLLHALLDALAPPLCALCGRPPGALPWLCEGCGRSLELFRAPLCLRCGAPRPLPVPTCPRCPPWPPRLVAARAAALHEGAARELVHALKFGRAVHAARPLGALAAAAARDLSLPPGTVVVPVPLHRSRRLQRGFNQAWEIAAEAARLLGLPLRPRLLERLRGGGGNAHRSASGRRRETRGAFRARPAARGAHVLLVDDVLTTGATIEACVRALSRRGVESVWAVAATRALRAE